jgi:hypothetical protein
VLARIRAVISAASTSWCQTGVHDGADDDQDGEDGDQRAASTVAAAVAVKPFAAHHAPSFRACQPATAVRRTRCTTREPVRCRRPVPLQAQHRLALPRPLATSTRLPQHRQQRPNGRTSRESTHTERIAATSRIVRGTSR